MASIKIVNTKTSVLAYAVASDKSNANRGEVKPKRDAWPADRLPATGRERETIDRLHHAE